MDRYHSTSAASRFAVACFLGSFAGCVASPLQVPTVWDKLGIPQATARLRDSTINRSGKFPGLEKKPPLLRIADPANLKPEKPEMIKAAAKIKADKDLKKQKIKAINFLADVNCGCYNKDDVVAKAFLAALDDCDPDVRKAAVEGLCKAAGNCSTCKTGCETTCCTEDILKKLQGIATGVDASGCFKEPVKEIRDAATALIRKCPCPPAKPIEEVPAPPPTEIEEIMAPDAEAKPIEGDGKAKEKEKKIEGGSTFNVRNGTISNVSYRLHDSNNLLGAEPVVVEKRGGSKATSNGKSASPDKSASADGITNPDQLIAARVVSNHKQLGELLVELPEVYRLNSGWTMVIVDKLGHQQVGRISEASGRRVLIALEGAPTLSADANQSIKMGLVRTK